MTTPSRPAARAHPATADVMRPASRMSAGTYIRSSTSMSSFRDTLGPERRFRREATRPRPLSSVVGGDAWRADTGRNEHVPAKLHGRASPTQSHASGTTSTGTPSRAIVNRLLATLRHPASDETHAMIHACIALQESLSSRASEGDMAFKHACQLIATDTHQINVNLVTALGVIARATTECEQAASPEEAQIGAIAALQTLGDLVASSRRASEEKVKSLHEVFARLSRQEGQGVVVPLPSVQEDEGRIGDDPDGSALPVPLDPNVSSGRVAPSHCRSCRTQTMPEVSTVERVHVETLQSTPNVDETSAVEQSPEIAQVPPTAVATAEPPTSDPLNEASSFVPPPASEAVKTRARKASSSSISVSLSPSNSFKITRSPAPPSLTHKASFMPSSLSMRTPTTALSRINVGSADEPGFDFDVKPKPKAVDQVEEESSQVSEEAAGAQLTRAPEAFRLNPLSLEIQTTPSAGRGVFATSDIPAQTIVEESPVLVLTKREWDDGKLDDGVLGGYGFNWTAGGMGVGLGIGRSSGRLSPMKLISRPLSLYV